MAKTKTVALVLFEDGSADCERIARSIAERLDPERFDSSVQPASAATAAGILPAALYFLGAESPGSPAWGEAARLLKGMNLAGRKAAFFGSSGAAVAWLRGLCADTEVSAAHADLVGRRPDPAALAAWLRIAIA